MGVELKKRITKAEELLKIDDCGFAKSTYTLFTETDAVRYYNKYVDGWNESVAEGQRSTND